MVLRGQPVASGGQFLRLGVLATLFGCSDPAPSEPPPTSQDATVEDVLDATGLDSSGDTPGDPATVDRPITRDGAGCASNAACAALPQTPVCDPRTGDCVRCTAADDRCPPDEHCDDATHSCVPGCRSDEGCTPDGGRQLYCNTTTRACVACLRDEHCTRATCVAGGCVPWCEPDRGCGAGQTCCTTSCADLMNNPMHCGACGMACPAAPNATASCTAGRCGFTCNPGFADCDMNAANGCEADTRSSSTHCGACGTMCTGRPNATGSCTAGSCTIQCNAGFGDCDMNAANGCEADTRASMAHCGACGMICPSVANGTPACTMGACTPVCNAGFGDCDGNPANGCETDTRATAAHCGRCGAACMAGPNATPTCASGTCRQVCNAGFGDCDGNAANGCETDTRSTAAHCNGCGMACPTRPNTTATCVMGACSTSCSPGFADCNGSMDDGCEVDTRTSTTNCGRCGAFCSARPNAAATCTAGACGLRCNAGYADCDVDVVNGCEVRTTNDPRNCGGCGVACEEWCVNSMCRPFPRSCQEYRTGDPTLTSGTYTVDTDGVGGAAPFAVYCDLALDDGGWTLLGAGTWNLGSAETVTTPGRGDVLLSDTRRNAILGASTLLYRLGSGAQRLYIRDTGAEFGPARPGGGRHYWRTNATSLRCGTTYTRVTADTLVTTSTRAMSCDPIGVGMHTCTITSGWILWHNNDTFDVSGGHPCSFGSGVSPTGGALYDLWVR